MEFVFQSATNSQFVVFVSPSTYCKYDVALHKVCIYYLIILALVWLDAHGLFSHISTRNKMLFLICRDTICQLGLVFTHHTCEAVRFSGKSRRNSIEIQRDSRG
jgi:hypothetical protein